MTRLKACRAGQATEPAWGVNQPAARPRPSACGGVRTDVERWRGGLPPPRLPHRRRWPSHRAAASLRGRRHRPRTPTPSSRVGLSVPTLCGHAVCGVSKSRWARLRVHGDDSVHGSCIPSFCKHQITPKTSRYTRCSMSMFPNASINGRIRSSGQLGRWWYSISPWRNNECVRRFTVFAFNQRS